MTEDSPIQDYGLKTEFPFETHQLLDITKKFGTPVYVYDAKTISNRLVTLKSLFKGLPVNWLYAMKANDNPHLLKLIAAQGFGFDTVSFEEVSLGLKIVEADRIFYTENNMSDSEMLLAMKEGVRLNIGSFSRLKKFAEAGGVSCSIRVVPEIGDGLHARVTTGHKESKFGIDLALIQDINDLQKQTKLRIEGIHMHIGSGIRKATNMIDAMKRLLDIGKQFEHLNFINFGGGFPIAYQENEHAFSLSDFAKKARELLLTDLEHRDGNFSYFFEPGRWITAQSGCLLTSVTSKKKAGSIQYLGTDTGFNHLARPILYDAQHRVIHLAKDVDSSTEKQNYTIAGNICESSDILARDVQLSEVKEGDILAFADAGAYGMTMASVYNRRQLPSEVLIENHLSVRLIRKKVDIQTHINRFFEETLFSE